MAAKTGVSILLQVEDQENPGTYRTLGGQRGATLNRSTSTADTTNKDSDPGWESNIPILNSWSIEADALLLTDDAAYADLKDAWRNRTQINVRVNDTEAGTTETGLATITDFPMEAPHDDMATVSITLQGTGALTEAEA